MTATSQPSAGLVIGLPIMSVLVLAVIAAGVLLIRWARRHPSAYSDDRVIARVGGWVLIAVAALATIGIGAVMWPWSYEYHSWQTVTGTVADVNSRLLPAGDKSVQQKFVVRFTDGRVRGVEDTRAALIKPGDLLTIKCKRAYQWSGTPGWDCSFVDDRPAGAR